MHVDVGKGKVDGPDVVVGGGFVVLLSVVFVVAVVVFGVVVLGVVVLGVLTVVVAGYLHCEHEASTVRLLGEQTSKGTWASAQM